MPKVDTLDGLGDANLKYLEPVFKIRLRCPNFVPKLVRRNAIMCRNCGKDVCLGNDKDAQCVCKKGTTRPKSTVLLILAESIKVQHGRYKNTNWNGIAKIEISVIFTIFISTMRQYAITQIHGGKFYQNNFPYRNDILWSWIVWELIRAQLLHDQFHKIHQESFN